VRQISMTYQMVFCTICYRGSTTEAATTR